MFRWTPRIPKAAVTSCLPMPECALLLCLDTNWPEIAAFSPDALPPAPPESDGLFYVVYTSGSTGTPKGVRMGRRAIAGLVEWQRNASVRPDVRTAQFAALGFDVSAQEIFGTLCGGGTLCLVPASLRFDPPGLLRFLDDCKVERLFLPFVALQQVAAAALEPGRLAALREVITAGEQLKITPAIRALFARLPNCTLHNQYGPSETHVATAYTLRGPVSEWPALPPIGRAVPGMLARVVDGELYLSGRQLAEGYQGRPDLTAERFAALPGTEERWYKTGDLARVSAEGELEFLGRADGQLKRRAADVFRSAYAGSAGAVPLCLFGCSAADAERQGGPAGPAVARSRASGVSRRIRGAVAGPGSFHCRSVVGRFGDCANRRGRQLL